MGKKALIIVPHQDDEINIAAGYIVSHKGEDIYVLYTTNGDFIFDAKYRYKEAIKSLEALGNIPKEKIFFLGYSDQAYDQDTHMYNQKEDWTSIKGYSETYAPSGYEEWNFRKHGKHCKFNVSNFINNIEEVILEISPDLIICVDLDFHPDHIMTSICFEKALGRILKQYDNYRPQVYKTFAYENSYLGPNDFFAPDYKPSFFNYDNDGNLVSNPYYNANRSIKLNLNKNCYTKNLFRNKVFKSILCHKSQLLVSHAGQMINSNAVYWTRRTDNLLLDSDISVSSGDASYLNDFVLCDTDDVLNGNVKEICYNSNIWIPENNDKNKDIYIKFKKKRYIEYINIYNGRVNDKYISNILIEYGNHSKEENLKKQPVNKIYIKKDIDSIRIKILDKKVLNGFSEIEAFDKEDHSNEVYHEINK